MEITDSHKEKKTKTTRPSYTWRDVPKLDIYAHYCALILKNGFEDKEELVKLIINCDAYNNGLYSPTRTVILRKFNFLIKKEDDDLYYGIDKGAWYGNKSIYYEVKDIFKNSEYKKYLSKTFEALHKMELRSQEIKEMVKDINRNSTMIEKEKENEINNSPEIIKKLRIENCLQITEELSDDNINNNKEIFPNIETETDIPSFTIIEENKDKSKDKDKKIESEWYETINEDGKTCYMKFDKNNNFSFSIDQKSLPRLLYCIENIDRNYKYKEEIHKYLKDAIEINGKDKFPYISEWALSSDGENWMFLTQAIALRISSKQILSLIRHVSYKKKINKKKENF